MAASDELELRREVVEERSAGTVVSVAVTSREVVHEFDFRLWAGTDAQTGGGIECPAVLIDDVEVDDPARGRVPAEAVRRLGDRLVREERGEVLAAFDRSPYRPGWASCRCDKSAVSRDREFTELS